jgi:cobalamin biosynthetic protein CobC
VEKQGMDTGETIPDATKELRYHGGNINAARRLFPNAPQPWIDLSTGINPEPYPIGTIAPCAWTRLPEPSDQAALEAAARAAYRADPSTGIVAASGTQALIQWLPRIFPARHVGILGDTYGEHERSWREAGANVTKIGELSALTAFDAAVVVNPNNPDGRILPPHLLAEAGWSMSRRGGLLVVDEAFMDVVGAQNSLVPRLPKAGALVLRSFGKTYGLAGLRLGFAIASAEATRMLRAAIGPWAVSGPAIEVGRRALMDASWLTGTVSRLSNDAARLDTLFRSAGFEVVGGTPLFRLVKHPDASLWFEHLAERGILTRPFNANLHWLRLGIPTAPEWERLEAALQSLLQTNLRKPR